MSSETLDLIYDNALGMIEGNLLGDALGAPHEFHYNKRIRYTGCLEHRIHSQGAYVGHRHSTIGQITDDGEITLTLLRSLARNDFRITWLAFNKIGFLN